MAIFEAVTHEHHHHEHHATVVEKRAPTDESVRLLHEMEQKARDAVLKSIRVKDCPIDMVLHKQLDIINAQTLFRSTYIVNNVRRDVLSRIDVGAAPQEIAEVLIQDLARDIAAILLAPHIRKALEK